MKKSLFFLFFISLSLCYGEDDLLSDIEDFLNSQSAQESQEQPAEESTEQSPLIPIEEPKIDNEEYPESSEDQDLNEVSNETSEMPSETDTLTDTPMTLEVYPDVEGGDEKVIEAQKKHKQKFDASKRKTIIPDKTHPMKADSELLEKARKRDKDGKEEEKTRDSIRFGTPQEISSLIQTLLDNEDVRFIEDLYELFYDTTSNEIKVNILNYFAKLKDPCLASYAVEIIDDPFDYPQSITDAVFNYVSETKVKEAATPIIHLLDNDEEKYFNIALMALGNTGDTWEAGYLAEYLQRDDLSIPQRQTLMKTLGKMNAIDTWDELCKIANNDDENNFVRMYACEAIGKMKKEGSIPILTKLYAQGDPNLRQYCIMGLKNFPQSNDARKTIIQAIRDDHWRVRLEAIKACKEMELEDSVDYLAYRAKNDNENVVKKECYGVIANLDTRKGNSWLIEQITDPKIADSIKSEVSAALLKEHKTGEKEILDLAKETLENEKRKPLRYALGKLFMKYAYDSFDDIAILYMQSKDNQTVSQGLEMYKAGRFPKAKSAVEEVYNNPKTIGGNKNLAAKLLGIEDKKE